MRRIFRICIVDHLLVWLSAGLLCMGLAACGGGGGGNAAIAPAASGTASQAGSNQILTSDGSSKNSLSQGTEGADPGISGVALLAGDTGGSGSIDGAGAAARFYDPQAITADAAGNLYVADTSNNTIRKITPSGVVSTLAGQAGSFGRADGTGSSARFSSPGGIAVDAAGNLYVADTLNHTIRKITPSGLVTTLAGTPGASGSNDGSGAVARFNAPSGVAIDAAGNLFVADTNNLIIRKITPAGMVSTLAGTAGAWGSADGDGAAARFSGPHGITVNAAGNLFVTDTEHFPSPLGSGSNSTVRKITPAGVVSTLAGTPGVLGSADGSGAAAQFNDPGGITVDATGNLYVADTYNGVIRKITSEGVVTTFAGTVGGGSDDGNGAAARFFYPTGITSDTAGNLYVADTSNSTIRKITSAATVTTLAGAALQYGSTDGNGTSARFNGPNGITADAGGNLYIADTYNSIIRKISPAGMVNTLAGTAGSGGWADAIGAAARFSGPYGIAADTQGNLYVADTANNMIRKITSSGAVSTLAGTGAYGSVDGSGASAQFSAPTGIAVDKSGNLYVADTGNNTIRKVSVAGVVSTLAGTPQLIGSADGTGANARFQAPAGIAVDDGGNVYVADVYNHTIRKISAAGVVTTLAGTAGASGSDDGNGASARFYYPRGLTVDAAGTVYVADTLNHTIRRITAAGAVSTIAGVANQQGIVLGALPGHLSSPLGITLTGRGTLAVTTGFSVVEVKMP
jgi:sugar lactone lactonase YvrE